MEEQTKAFLDGFNEVVPLEWLRYFDEKELEVRKTSWVGVWGCTGYTGYEPLKTDESQKYSNHTSSHLKLTHHGLYFKCILPFFTHLNMLMS